MAVFDTKQYAWKDITVVMLGRPVAGLREIRFKGSVEHEPVYGAGDEPQTINSGNKMYEGQISLLQSEMEALLRATSNKPGDVSLDIVVAFSANGVIITHIVKSAKLGEWELGMTQNDKFMEIAVPFTALGIDYNV